ncbi:M48 family metallopeptidase [Roseovarius pacificus]|uniref:M48 family metallopeptidase n=1 Tax=Roseovarius pacificus TaxID=337701 RepID=UPI002A189FD0|nr:M48 family metallopeptidase [Roseovarius pacificus]
MDGSKRSAHSNAYFTGIGSSRRIVLFDTLINSLEDDELEAVLAHEIGHWKFGHIRTRLLVSAFASLAVFALIGAGLYWQNLFTAFGFNDPSLHALLFWLSFYLGPISLAAAPIGNFLSRKHEYQADRFAAAACGTSETMKRALLSLNRENLSNLNPHPAYSFWHYSHPAPTERLSALDELKAPKSDHIDNG